MKNLHFILVAFIMSLTQISGQSLARTNSYSLKTQKTEKVKYQDWELLLQKHVTPNGIVDYIGFKKDITKFNLFLTELSNTKINSTWTKEDKMAYWINVYNAFTIKLVVYNYPVRSIKEIDNPWKQSFFKINGKMMSLDQVEHEILRKFNDPRIHFAINCASASCPRLIQIAYTSENLYRLLERQTKEFINDPFYNTITNYTVNVSKIFSWFKKDFKDYSGSVENFINQYSSIKINNQKEKGFKNYDWSINTK